MESPVESVPSSNGLDRFGIDFLSLEMGNVAGDDEPNKNSHLSRRRFFLTPAKVNILSFSRLTDIFKMNDFAFNNFYRQQ
jgi:hypothetical protein